MEETAGSATLAAACCGALLAVCEVFEALVAAAPLAVLTVGVVTLNDASDVLAAVTLDGAEAVADALSAPLAVAAGCEGELEALNETCWVSLPAETLAWPSMLTGPDTGSRRRPVCSVSSISAPPAGSPCAKPSKCPISCISTVSRSMRP